MLRKWNKAGKVISGIISCIIIIMKGKFEASLT